MGRFSRYSAGLAKRMVVYGLQALTPEQRAGFMQMLVEDMVSVIPIDGAKIAMYHIFHIEDKLFEYGFIGAKLSGVLLIDLCNAGRIARALGELFYDGGNRIPRHQAWESEIQ